MYHRERGRGGSSSSESQYGRGSTQLNRYIIWSGLVVKISMVITGAEFLRGRGWKGLERRLGEGGVATANEGRRGVASAYSHEQTHSIK